MLLKENNRSETINKFNRILIIGGRGAIGRAFIDHFKQFENTEIITISRSIHLTENINNLTKTFSNNSVLCEFYVDYENEIELQNTVDTIIVKGKLDLVILATGFLQNEEIKPEKSIKDISRSNLEHVFYINTFLPAIMIKHFLPHLNTNNISVFAALSARVGSISDNRLGGWYSYRASKSALNMLIKSASIELRRINRNGIIVGLHPGTVETNLSKPFLKKDHTNNFFSPTTSVSYLAHVINSLTQNHSGKIIAWDNKEITP